VWDRHAAGRTGDGIDDVGRAGARSWGRRREEVRKRDTAAQVGDRRNGDRRGARERSRLDEFFVSYNSMETSRTDSRNCSN
jgi:hypothetical protein